jgi:hypothetical protein
MKMIDVRLQKLEQEREAIESSGVNDIIIFDPDESEEVTNKRVKEFHRRYPNYACVMLPRKEEIE